MNPLKTLQQYGQAPWLDYIRRGLIESGELRRLIDEDGLAGVTSNPAIFEKAITGSTDYSDQLTRLRGAGDLTPMEIYERIAVEDVRDAARVLGSVYEATGGRDGYVSLEVSPFLAHDTARTIEEARRLWKAVGAPNLMIKVPATEEGIPAIEQLISEGINVNVTLLFSQEVYERVAWAYIGGLERYAASGGDAGKPASVASFFVSRIDSAIESILARRIPQADSEQERRLLYGLSGKLAIANAKLAYQRFQRILASERWRALAARGAHPQRLLWASTSTKDPRFRDVLYVEELIGPETVNTLPPATWDAFRDHGRVAATIESGLEEAAAVLQTLATLGISLNEVTTGLVRQGVKLFAEAFDKLLSAVNERCRFASKQKVNWQSHHLPAELEAAVNQELDNWLIQGKVHRLWARDATLWTGADEARWLGWLGAVEDLAEDPQPLVDLAAEVRAANFSHILLLGMGGSSLCPEVLALTFGKQDGFPEMHVLDSTDPVQVKAFETKIDPARTLFIVSSKSGSTLEPNIFKKYFFERASAGSRFIAVTDPGSNLEKEAKADGFWRIFHGIPTIGGRYSALSNFGMAPAAAMGLDVTAFLDHADRMAVCCSPCLPPRENPGVLLGVILGVAANHGRNKVTLIASPGIHDLGAWLEQLLAESTGKQGKAIVPVDREPAVSAGDYGSDRLFVYLRLETGPDPAQDEAVEALRSAGHPVVTITVDEPATLGQEFFRWEIATAAAGAVMGINPFDQPDVEASKVETRKLTAEFERTGALPAEQPFRADGGLSLFADAANTRALAAAAADASLQAVLKAHLDRLAPGDYFGLLAYLPMNAENEEILQRIRGLVLESKRVATCLGFGPRFLHSTGQAYKGGPNTGVFLQITCDDAIDLPVPGQRYTFGIVKAAQARGDFAVLAERGRRALRCHLPADVATGLRRLEGLVSKALSG